jgi:hypothetical protein
MRRRDFVKAIVAMPVTANMMLAQHIAAPQPATRTPQPMDEPGPALIGVPGRRLPSIVSTVPDQVATTEAHFFNDRQLATLRKLSSTLMPPLKGYPGALQADAPEFIDFLIGASPVDRQEMYQSGLEQLDTNAKKHFGVPFAQVDAAQADTLLRPWLKTWMSDHPPSEPYAHFINVAHQDIRTATMNSCAWSVAATSAGLDTPGMDLYWSPIDPDIQMYV